MSRIISILFTSLVIAIATGACFLTATANAYGSSLKKRNSASKNLSNKSEVETAIRKVFGPKYDDTAICIAVMESHGPVNGRIWKPGMKIIVNPKAWSDTGDHGIFQANYAAHHRSGETELEFHKRMSNSWYAINWAHRLSREGKSFYPWTGTYARGLCRGLS